PQDGFPAQTCLRAFQDQKLKQSAIVMNGSAPFAIVISDGQITPRPLAPNWMLIVCARHAGGIMLVFAVDYNLDCVEQVGRLNRLCQVRLETGGKGHLAIVLGRKSRERNRWNLVNIG